MKIPYLEFDNCLRDPEKWVANKLNPSGPIPRPGYNHYLREGIYHFHKNADPVKAREYILELLRRRDLLNGIRIDDIIDRFDSYVTWFEGARVTVAAHRFILSYELVDGVMLGGTISRIDMTPVGYRAILLSHIPPNWKQQFWMPLIQRALAKQYKRPEERFSVGYQELNGSNLEDLTFPSAQLDDAEYKAQQLATSVASEISKFAKS